MNVLGVEHPHYRNINVITIYTRVYLIVANEAHSQSCVHDVKLKFLAELDRSLIRILEEGEGGFVSA